MVKQPRRSRYGLFGVLLVSALVLLAGCGNAHTANTPSAGAWTQRTPTGPHPSERASACVIFDTDLHRMLVLGGYYLGATADSEVDFNDLWSYDPATNVWTELKPTGDIPPAGGSPLGVYDTRAKKWLIYGGYLGNWQGGASRLWAYDASANTFVELHPAGIIPPCLDGASVAYDQSSGRMLLFGGNITSASDQTGRLVFSNDLYAYDSASNTWEKLNVFGPRPAGRFGQTMVCDVRSRSLIVFGGASFPDQRSGCQNSSDEKPVMYAETWRFDLDADTWRQLKGIDSTLSALGLAAASDSLSGRTLVYSGASSSGKFETTAELYDVAQDRWTAEKPAGSPPARVMPALVYDPDVGGFLLYGGTQSRTGPNLSTSAPLFTYFDDVWIYKSGVTSK